MNPFEFVLVLAAMGITAGLLGTVLRTVGRFLERRAEVGGAGDVAALRGELDALRLQLAEQDELRQRVSELEERLDFAERLLARQGGQAQLPKS